MALTTLAEIKTAAINSGLARSDLDDFANDYVTLAEGHFNRHLRHRKMVTTTDLSPTSNVYTLPTDFLHAERVVEKASVRRELEYITPSYVEQKFMDRAAGLSRFYTIVGESLHTYPLSDNDVELTYYQKIPDLVTNSTGNWLLTESPQLYLRGIQMQALIAMNETETPRFQTIVMMVKALIEELNQQSQLALYSSSSVRIRGVTP